MPGVARAGFRTPLANIQPATKRKQHLLIVVAKHQPQNGPKENSTCLLSLPINSPRTDQK
jgi:hypothetical protein